MSRTKRGAVYKARSILSGNDGASIVLVTIIAIIVITAVVILRVTTSSLWASADKTYNQDQAYMIASSMGEAIDAKILNGEDPMEFNGKNDNDTLSKYYNSSVEITVLQSSYDGADFYTVTVNAGAGSAEYQYRAIYQEVAGSYARIG